MAAFLSQAHFRIRNDAGTVDSTPTWLAAEDVNADPGIANFRLRIGIANWDAATASQAWQLYSSKNGGVYAPVTIISTNGIKSVDAGTSADETALLIQRLTTPTAPIGQATHFDPAAAGSNIVLSNRNDTATLSSGGAWKSAFSSTSKAVSDNGLYYYEFKVNAIANTSNLLFGLLICLFNGAIGDYKENWMGGTGGPSTGWERAASGSGAAIGNYITYIGTTTSYTAAADDIISLAINLNSQKAWVGYNNDFGSGNPATGANPDFTWDKASLIANLYHDWYIGLSLNDSSGSVSATLKTASATQTYSPPSGFSPWDS